MDPWLFTPACTKPSLSTYVACVQHLSARINPFEVICNRDSGKPHLKSGFCCALMCWETGCDSLPGQSAAAGVQLQAAACAPRCQWGWGPLSVPSPRPGCALILYHGKAQHRKPGRNMVLVGCSAPGKRYSSALLGLKAIRSRGTPASPGRLSRATRYHSMAGI